MDPSQRSVIRLQTLKLPPTLQELRDLLSSAQQEAGRHMQLPWTDELSKTQYALSVVAPARGDPQWTLSEGSRQIWIHATGDVALILNLVFAECTGTYQPVATSELDQRITFHNLQQLNKRYTVTGAHEPYAQSSGQPAPEARKESDHNKMVLAGDLGDMGVAALLQSIAVTNLTGRLGARHQSDKIEVYFVEGSPVHAVSNAGSGDEAMLDFMTWQVGTFKFHPKETTTERTNKKRFHAILFEGVALLDQYKSLVKSGLKMKCYPLRKFPQMTEVEFEERIAGGLPLDVRDQKRFYKQIDHVSTMLEILRRRPIPKSLWVPILFNLVNCDLVALSDKPTQAAKRYLLEPVGIDQKVILEARRTLLRIDSHLPSYPLFLYFMDLEDKRSKAWNLPYSIIVMHVGVREGKNFAPLSSEAQKRMASIVSEVINHYDVFAHYKTLDYAVLLPHTNVDGAIIVAESIIDQLRQGNFAGTDPSNVGISCGVAAYPDDCMDIGRLLSAAEEAKQKAQVSGSPIMPFRQLYTNT